MKAIIIYYSYSGNTKKVSDILGGALKEKGQVEIITLNALDESNNFLGQCARAFKHIKASIKPVENNLSQYDLICLGTPVWAFGPAPAMNTYLDQCRGLEGKEVILFTTYGSGTGNERCLNKMQDVLSKKGVVGFKRFSIQQARVKDEEFVTSQIIKVLGE